MHNVEEVVLCLFFVIQNNIKLCWNFVLIYIVCIDCRLYVCLILNFLYILELQYVIEATKKEKKGYGKTIKNLTAKISFDYV